MLNSRSSRCYSIRKFGFFPTSPLTLYPTYSHTPRCVVLSPTLHPPPSMVPYPRSLSLRRPRSSPVRPSICAGSSTCTGSDLGEAFPSPPRSGSNNQRSCPKCFRLDSGAKIAYRGRQRTASAFRHRSATRYRRRPLERRLLELGDERSRALGERTIRWPNAI